MLFILILLSIALGLWFVFDKKRYENYPPGPLRIPLFGNLIQLAWLAPFPHLAFQKLSKVYGDIVFVRMGFQNAITFNSYETVRDILNHENATERSQTMVPMLWERMQKKNIGIIFANGKEWQTLRRYTIRTLRDFGFGKEASMDVVINEELEKFTDHLKTLNQENPEGIPEAQRLFDLTIINILWRLVTGVKYEYNDKNMLKLLHLSHEMTQNSSFAMDNTIAFPPLYDMFPNWAGKTKNQDILKRLCDFARDTIAVHRKKGDYQTSPKSYVDEFLSKIEENKNGSSAEFTDEQLVLCLLDLFQAGSDTSSNTLGFSTQYMIFYPEIQEKVQSEIDTILSKDESIMMSDRARLPYTHATLLECMRHSTVVPVAPARQAGNDFHFNGHFIRKGTILMANLYAAHFSEKLWGDPYNFRPERFLNAEGEVDPKIAGHLQNFGNGSRKCLAATVAETSLFLYFSTILRDFKILKAKDGKEMDRMPNLGLSLVPKSYKARYVPRIRK